MPFIAPDVPSKATAEAVPRTRVHDDMRRTNKLFFRAGPVLALFALGSCSDRSGSGVGPQPGPPSAEPVELAALDCAADVRAGRIQCGPARPGGAGSHLVVGGQHTFIRLENTTPTLEAATRVFSASFRLTSLVGQPLGTRDGTTPAPEGVRAFFADDPTHGVTVRDPDGVGTFTAVDQPYYQWTQVLATGGTTEAKTWRFTLPAGVEQFTFRVLVSAPVPHERGWIDVTPDTVPVAAGGTQRLWAAVRDVMGREISGLAVQWSSSDTTVATVDTAGVLTVRAGGTATITATSGTRTGAARVAAGGAPLTPGNPGAADVTFTLDSRTRWPVSRFIYGMNFYDGWLDYQAFRGAALPANLTLGRHGGNRLSAFNWENNASNAGRDWFYHNDGYMGGGNVPGEAVRQPVLRTLQKGAGIVVTVPMLGYVSRDKNGATGHDEASLQQRLATRFRRSLPRKGAEFSATPDTADAYVYQDEFAWWLDRQFPLAKSDALRPIFFSLDNEPDIWFDTHEEVRSRVGGQPNYLTYTELANLTVEYAAAIKDVQPNAVVFGPVVATWTGATTLGRWPNPDPVAGTADFLEWYLDRMRQAHQQQGRRLVDVLDIHWYPAAGAGGYEITNDAAPQTAAMVEARLQAPRSLWDPTFTDGNWVEDVTGGPVRLLPRLREKIAAHYPGTRIAITEYWYGRGGDITGAIAQADVLGIFGREGVFAATLWPLARVDEVWGGSAAAAYAWVFGAFRMFRDYDGAGGSFGDVGFSAQTSDVANTSVYASLDPADPGRVVVVAINKSASAKTAAIRLTHHVALTKAEVYTLTSASSSPVRQADRTVAQNAFLYPMPARSVTTLVLRP
jgi:Glycoside hydrolase family 44/Bacterial Ig-like domain (group 2)